MIIALSVCFIFPFLPKNVGNRLQAAEVAANLAYTYIMDTPVAVSADGDKLYALAANGDVIDVTNGMNVIEKRAGATKFDVSGDRVITNTEDDSVAVFCDTITAEMTPDAITAEMTPDAIYLITGNSKSQIVSAEVGQPFVGGALCGDVLYAAAKVGASGSKVRYALYSFDLSNNNTQTLIKYENADGEITAMTALSSTEIYYSTATSLYSVGHPVGEASEWPLGGITSLSNDGEKLFFTTKSGKIQSFDGKKSETILSASEQVSVTTRKNSALFTDKGNNVVTLVRDGVTLTNKNVERSTAIEQPTSSAIDYSGNVYVASVNRVMTFTGSLEYSGKETDMFFGNAADPIKKIAVDPSDVTDCTLYALTESGMLYRSTDDNTASGIASIDISADGEVYAMKSDGSVVVLSDDLTSETEKAAGGSYVDFAVDKGGHIYRAAADGIYRDNETTPVYDGTGIADIEISLVSLSGDGKAVSYGDIVIIGTDEYSSRVLPRATARTDMRDDKTNEEYTNFMQTVDSAQPNDSNYAPIIRRAATSSDVYDFPAETPVSGNREINVGACVIIITRYADTDYYYAIAETSRGSIKGFVNGNTLAEPLPLKDNSDKCVPLSTADVFKYPSQVSPVIGSIALGESFSLLPFPETYRDSAGREWCRIAYTDGNGTYDGYVLRTNVAVGGHTGGYNRDIYTDAVIKADSETVSTYIDADGLYELGMIANGTPIKLEESFNKSREFTKITYVSDETTGATTTCYVRTEFIKHTEAGWYQVIFFIVGGVVIVAIVVIIVIRINKKRRID